jgi:hypothetical protein
MFLRLLTDSLSPCNLLEIHSRTDYEGPVGNTGIAVLFFFTSALDGVGGSHSAPPSLHHVAANRQW